MAPPLRLNRVIRIVRFDVLDRAFLFAGLVAVTSVAAVSREVSGQATKASATAAAAPNPATPSGVKRVPISKSVFGDAGIIVNARDDGFVEVAAAGPQKTVLIQLRTMAARAWVDSTSRMLRARPRRSATPRTYRADVQEHGTSTTMALTRKVTNGESEYSLFFSDDPLAGFTVPVEKSEADVFVAVVRRAVATSAKMLDKEDSTRAAKDSTAKPAPKKKPAVKRPASPPAKAPVPAPAKP